MQLPLIAFDKAAIRGYTGLIGVDEAGRGALAGPVVAAAVYIVPNFFKKKQYPEVCKLINDSKQMLPADRETVFEFAKQLQVEKALDYAISLRDVVAIEHYNILRATQQAMTEAVTLLHHKYQESLDQPPMFSLSDSSKKTPTQAKIRILIDGNPLKHFPYEHDGIVKGDTQSFSIALASILAKVSRDRLMVDYQTDYPPYNFSQHKGYGTQEHRHEILTHGPSSIHRLSFIKKILDTQTVTDQTEFQWL